ncbi:hypothetical protein [Nocardioides sp. WS12]|uniref:hypothetical protein n=1 Tax=Nocardioides sp. WS12 TaxID=2486272 RepID=UPI0015FB4DD7|nr:hypothetical protein [Nocardioides sp. WS12]
MLKRLMAALVVVGGSLSLSPTMAPAEASGTPLTIAIGRVVNALGVPVSGASVELQMWPNDATLDAAQEGDPINLVTVASASTTSGGDFQLVLPRISDLAPGAVGDNVVDFSLVATSPNGESSRFAFSRRLVNTSVLGLSVIEALVDPEMPQNLINTLISGLTQQVVVPLTGVLLGSTGIGGIIDSALPTADVAADEVPESEFVPVEEPEPVVDKACSTYVKKDYGQRVTQVNAAGVGWSGATTDFVYTDGAMSTLGVGVSTSGSYGSFKASGTSSKERTSSGTLSTEFPLKSTGYWSRKTNFRYKKYEIFCVYYGGGSATQYEARPSNYSGGATTYGSTTLPNTPRDYCVFQETGSGATKATSTAVTWTNGVALSGAIGIDVSARTGYTTDAKVSFKFKTQGWLCGTGGDPGGTPRTLVARKYRPTS